MDSPVGRDAVESDGTDSKNAVDTVTAPLSVQKKSKKVKKKRPARVQVDPATSKSQQPEASGTIFNIWYNKWSGGDRDVPVQFAAPGRCNVAKDRGYTRADGIPGSYFCLHFARGICTKGCDCEYLHRLPGLHDIFNPNLDCFGRDKFSDYRDDMGGVGSFMRQNRTLYVGRIHVTDDIEEIVARHFAEWGQVERIRVLNMRGVAFITYSNLANSEFAKEAMAHQTLDHGEVLNVRWATVDPNPQAQKRDARSIEEQAAEAIRRTLAPEYIAQLEAGPLDARKRRKAGEAYGLENYEVPDDVLFAGNYSTNISSGDQRQLDQGGVMASGALQNGHDSQPEQQNNGIFSASTLSLVGSRRLVVSDQASKSTKLSVSSTPLVTYDSDDSDDSD